MKKLIILVSLLLFTASTFSQEKPKLYHPEADGSEQIKQAIKAAKTNNKHVFVQIGGNWCGWCILFNKFVNEDAEIKKYIADNYEVVHLNYSPENYNEKLLTKFEHPERFGFPVFIVLNEKGERLHTQNSGLLEEGKGYNQRDVLQFFKHWSPTALDPETYKK